MKEQLIKYVEEVKGIIEKRAILKLGINNITLAIIKVHELISKIHMRLN